MRRRRLEAGPPLMMLLLLDLMLLADSVGWSPPVLPGWSPPTVLGCRSPEKETFTCWWRPGSDGGRWTEHRLYYQREDLEGTHECPDYHSGGENSCFFDKNHTSIWVEYYLTVVASGSSGNVSSEPLKIDVMDIVKPDAPENVALQVEERKETPHLHIRWQHPSNTDTKSGWVSIKYQLRVKQEDSSQWNNYTSGRQTHFSLYSMRPGALYLVQVRCALDHGSWSQWSNTTSITIPNYLDSVGLSWVLLSTLFIVALCATTCVFVMRRKDVKKILLPPVPGPKIKGVDVQLLQSAQSDDIIDALIFTENFPPMVAWEDQTEEYLVVSDKDDRLWLHSSNSMRNQGGPSLPDSSYFDSEIQRTESIRPQRDSKNVKESIDVKDLFGTKCHSEETSQNKEPSQLHIPEKLSTGVDIVKRNVVDQDKDAADITVQPLAHSSGYVAIQRPDGVPEEDYSTVSSNNVLMPKKENVPLDLDIERLEEDLLEGYSRVEEVKSDNVVLLHKHVDSFHEEKRNIYPEFSNQKAGTPYVTGPSEAGLCTELIGNGYVDTVPSLPLI